jgi:hypothetical protein
MDGYTAVTVSFLGLLFVVGVLAAMALLLPRQPAQPRPQAPARQESRKHIRTFTLPRTSRDTNRTLIDLNERKSR